jgi:dihydrolipoamide dehydrogenase
MTQQKTYDLVVIGSGPGGYVAALYASRQKLNVCVIEKDLLGGACLNRGCIPTKVLLNSARVLSTIASSSQYGIDVQGYKLNYDVINKRKSDIVLRLRTGIETLFRANKIDLIKGEAVITCSGVVTVNGSEEIRGTNIIIATGSKPSTIPGVSIDEEDIMSSNGALSLKELPKSILIVGGGVIGVEFASLFNSFGVKVTIVEMLDRLISMQSREASKKLELIFKKRGIEILTNVKVGSIIKNAGELNVNISSGTVVVAEKVLICAGRERLTQGLGCEKAGIGIDRGMIVVDKSLETQAKGIYAIGDCVNGPQLAHKASYEGILAVDNILGRSRVLDHSNIPNCIYTDPEVASVGLTEETAKELYPDAKVAKFPYLASGKAYLLGKPEGFIKLIGDSFGVILGVEILGEGATDLIGEAVLARSLGTNIRDLAHVVHGHPTLSEIIQEAAHVFIGAPIHSI